MKILQISTPFIPLRRDVRYGGIERVVYSLVQELHKRGHDVSIVAPRNSEINGRLLPTLEKGIFEYPINEISFDGFYLRQYHVKRGLTYAQGGDFDAVHLHDENFLLDLGSIHAPVLLTLHNNYSSFWKVELIPDITKIPQNVTLAAISRSLQTQYTEKGFPVEHVVHHGIDTMDFPFSREKLNYLLSIGVIAERKGQHHAVSVFDEADSDLIIAGPVEDAEYFRRISQRMDYDLSESRDKVADYLSLSDRKKLIYVGEVDSAQRNPLYANARAFLMPIQWEEPFGLTMVEAMACGTPVIAFNRGSVPEVVADGKTGFVVAGPEEMVEAVRNIRSIRPEDCRRHVEENFSTERMTEDYLKLYEDKACAA